MLLLRCTSSFNFSNEKNVVKMSHFKQSLHSNFVKTKPVTFASPPVILFLAQLVMTTSFVYYDICGNALLLHILVKVSV